MSKPTLSTQVDTILDNYWENHADSLMDDSALDPAIKLKSELLALFDTYVQEVIGKDDTGAATQNELNFQWRLNKLRESQRLTAKELLG